MEISASKQKLLTAGEKELVTIPTKEWRQCEYVSSEQS
jgi:hypothetical protein